MQFYIGQKVVCIDSGNRTLPCNNLIKDNIYTIKGFTFNGNGVLLKEVLGFHPSAGFWADRFVALKEQTFPLLTYSKILKEVLISSN
jgi:hypothetical protein